MSRPHPQRINTSAAVLWASAFVIAALVIVQAGRLPGRPAYGEMVSTRADYTILTARSGRGRDEEPDEILFVIDNRDGVLMVYEMPDARRGKIFARDGGRLENLFQSARH